MNRNQILGEQKKPHQPKHSHTHTQTVAHIRETNRSEYRERPYQGKESERDRGEERKRKNHAGVIHIEWCRCESEMEQHKAQIRIYHVYTQHIAFIQSSQRELLYTHGKIKVL